MLVSKWKKEKWGGITFRGPLSAYQTFCMALVNPTSPPSLTLPLSPPHPEPDCRIFKNRSPLLSLMQLRLCGASAKKNKKTSVVPNDLLMRQRRTTAKKNSVKHRPPSPRMSVAERVYACARLRRLGKNNLHCFLSLRVPK